MATGGAVLSYQWQFNGTNLLDATNASLLVSNVGTNSAGSYQVIVPNGAGSVTSSIAVLTILQPPIITSQPRTRAGVPGGTATFSVGAKGPLPRHFQWRFNGSDIGGQTNSILTLTNLQITQLGGYSMLVTNSDGALLSDTANLLGSTMPVSNHWQAHWFAPTRGGWRKPQPTRFLAISASRGGTVE